MASSPKATEADAGGFSWTSPQRRPRPQPILASTHDISRNSGLLAATGTMGASGRFTDKITGRGACSPDGPDFYKRSSLYKGSLEKGLECTMGIGERTDITLKLPPNVGPGSYDIVASAAHKKSPLDGPEFCSTTMRGRLPSTLVPAASCSPGPHHKYEVRKPLNSDCPTYQFGSLEHGSRHHFAEDMDTPGPGYYPVTHYKSVASSGSAPDLSSTMPAKMRTVKSTFGTSDRFRTGRQTSSPIGEYYYAHNNSAADGEHYLAVARSCTFGKDTKTDLSNPLRGPRFQVSPVSYSVDLSQSHRTSSLTGLAARQASPIATYARALGATARRGGSRTPGAGRGARAGQDTDAGDPRAAGPAGEGGGELVAA